MVELLKAPKSLSPPLLIDKEKTQQSREQLQETQEDQDKRAEKVQDKAHHIRKLERKRKSRRLRPKQTLKQWKKLINQKYKRL